MSPSKVTIADGEKKFVIQHVFKNVMAMEKDKRHYGPTDTHYDIPWKIGIYVSVENLWLGLKCDKFCGLGEWFISTDISTTITTQLGEKDTFSMERIFNQTDDSNYGMKQFSIKEANKYIADGDLTVKFEVKIGTMKGIREKLRSFDKESAEKFSDIVLVVQDEKFYVNKTYLSQHSPFFNALFLKKFSESEQSETELKNIEPWEFQNFLEVLYGESAIDDDTIEGILKLADMYDAPTVTRRCQEFLLKTSKRSLTLKFKLVSKYNIEELVNKYLSEMKTTSDIEDAVPKVAIDFDNWELRELLMKLLDFKSPE